MSKCLIGYIVSLFIGYYRIKMKFLGLFFRMLFLCILFSCFFMNWLLSLLRFVIKIFRFHSSLMYEDYTNSVFVIIFFLLEKMISLSCSIGRDMSRLLLQPSVISGLNSVLFWFQIRRKIINTINRKRKWESCVDFFSPHIFWHDNVGPFMI